MLDFSTPLNIANHVVRVRMLPTWGNLCRVICLWTGEFVRRQIYIHVFSHTWFSTLINVVRYVSFSALYLNVCRCTCMVSRLRLCEHTTEIVSVCTARRDVMTRIWNLSCSQALDLTSRKMKPRYSDDDDNDTFPRAAPYSVIIFPRVASFSQSRPTSFLISRKSSIYFSS